LDPVFGLDSLRKKNVAPIGTVTIMSVAQLYGCCFFMPFRKYARSVRKVVYLD